MDAPQSSSKGNLQSDLNQSKVHEDKVGSPTHSENKDKPPLTSTVQVDNSDVSQKQNDIAHHNAKSIDDNAVKAIKKYEHHSNHKVYKRKHSNSIHSKALSNTTDAESNSLFLAELDEQYQDLISAMHYEGSSLSDYTSLFNKRASLSKSNIVEKDIIHNASDESYNTHTYQETNLKNLHQIIEKYEQTLHSSRDFYESENQRMQDKIHKLEHKNTEIKTKLKLAESNLSKNQIVMETMSAKHKNEVTAWKDKYDMVLIDLDKEKQSNEMLIDKISKFTEKQAALDEKLKKSGSDIIETNAKNVSLQKQYDCCEEKFKSLQTEFDTYKQNAEHKMNEKQKQVDDFQLQIRTLSENMEEKSQEISKLQSENSKLQAASQELEQRVQQLKIDQLQEILKQEITEIHSEIHNEKSKTVSPVKIKRSQSDKQIAGKVSMVTPVRQLQPVQNNTLQRVVASPDYTGKNLLVQNQLKSSSALIKYYDADEKSNKLESEMSVGFDKNPKLIHNPDSPSIQSYSTTVYNNERNANGYNKNQDQNASDSYVSIYSQPDNEPGFQSNTQIRIQNELKRLESQKSSFEKEFQQMDQENEEFRQQINDYQATIESLRQKLQQFESIIKLSKSTNTDSSQLPELPKDNLQNKINSQAIDRYKMLINEKDSRMTNLSSKIRILSDKNSSLEQSVHHQQQITHELQDCVDKLQNQLYNCEQDLVSFSYSYNVSLKVRTFKIIL